MWCWLRNVLGQWAWYRRKTIGHWECWTLPGTLGNAWFQVQRCYYTRGYGPDPRLLGRPVACEHHWGPDCQFANPDDVLQVPGHVCCPVCRKTVSEHAACRCRRDFLDDPGLVYRGCTGQLLQVSAAWGRLSDRALPEAAEGQ